MVSRVWAHQNCAVSKGKDAMMKLRTAHCFDRTCLEQQGAVTNGKDATVKLSGACAAIQRLASGPLSSPGVALVLISGILAAKRQRPYSPTDAFLASRPATAADRSPLLRTASESGSASSAFGWRLPQWAGALALARRRRRADAKQHHSSLRLGSARQRPRSMRCLTSPLRRDVSPTHVAGNLEPSWCQPPKKMHKSNRTQ